jgi:hypothetical protein
MIGGIAEKPPRSNLTDLFKGRTLVPLNRRSMGEAAQIAVIRSPVAKNQAGGWM